MCLHVSRCVETDKQTDRQTQIYIYYSVYVDLGERKLALLLSQFVSSVVWLLALYSPQVRSSLGPYLTIKSICDMRSENRA